MEDKEGFCEQEMKEWIEKVKISRDHFSPNGKNGGSQADKDFYTKALCQAVDIDDIRQYCKDKQNFMENFVKPNLFTPTGGEYKFQFDCVAEAAKTVFRL